MSADQSFMDDIQVILETMNNVVIQVNDVHDTLLSMGEFVISLTQEVDDIMKSLESVTLSDEQQTKEAFSQMLDRCHLILDKTTKVKQHLVRKYVSVLKEETPVNP